MRRLAAVLSMLALAGCAAGQVRNPVPAALADKAHITGMAAARFWYDEKLVNPDQILRRLGLQTLSNTAGAGLSRPEVNYLALALARPQPTGIESTIPTLQLRFTASASFSIL